MCVLMRQNIRGGWEDSVDFRGCPRGRSNSGSVRQSESVARTLVCLLCAWEGGRECNVMVVRVRVRRDATTDGCATVKRV